MAPSPRTVRDFTNGDSALFVIDGRRSNRCAENASLQSDGNSAMSDV
jgi:hypothetical protein